MVVITTKNIEEMPKMDFTFRKDMLKAYQPERLKPENIECNIILPCGDEKGSEPKVTENICDSPI